MRHDWEMVAGFVKADVSIVPETEQLNVHAAPVLDLMLISFAHGRDVGGQTVRDDGIFGFHIVCSLRPLPARISYKSKGILYAKSKAGKVGRAEKKRTERRKRKAEKREKGRTGKETKKRKKGERAKRER